MGFISNHSRPNRAERHRENIAEEQRQRVAAAAAYALEMARIQEEQQLAHIAAVMLAAKAEIEAWYAAEHAKSQEQYAQSHNDHVKSLDDLQQSQDIYAQELTKENKAHIAALIQNQQADEEYLEQCYSLLSEMLNELQEYAKAEPAQVQLNTVDITECSDMVAELNQLLQEHDIDCLDTPQANITVAEAIEVITAIQGNLAIAQQEFHEQYELTILELNAEFAQKLLDSKHMHEQMLAQVEAQWLEYQSNHNAYVTSLAEHRDSQLNDINNQELQEIANVHAAYQAQVAAINAEMQLRLKEIDDNLAAQTAYLKNSAQAFMIAAVVMVGASLAAYFSAGLLAGFSAHIINFVRTTLAVTSLRAAERLANGQGGVSVDVSANLAPQPKPYTPPPVVQPKLNTKIAIEDSEQKVPATNTFSDRMQSVQNSTAERHKLLQEVHGQGYIPESSLATIGVVAVASATTQLVKDVAHTSGAIIDMCADGHASIFSASDTHRVEALQRNIERADNIKQEISNVVKNPSVITDYYKDRMQHAANSFETAFERGDLVGAGKAMGQNLYDASTVLSIASGATAFTAKVATGAAKTASNFITANKFVAPVTFQYKGATLYSGIPFDAVKVRNPVVPKAPAANMAAEVHEGMNFGKNSVKLDRTIKDPLRRDRYGNPAIDSEFEGKAHTQLGTKISKRNDDQTYIQGREFDSNGQHTKDIDVTDHGRPFEHTNPHQHRWIKNETGGTYASNKPPLNQFQNFKLTLEGRKVSTGGLRNEMPLTQAQEISVREYAKKLGVSEEGIIFTDTGNTCYKLIFGKIDLLYIGTDAAPAVGKGLSANSRISLRGAVAHEVVGHRAAELAGKTHQSHILEEVQASIRAARFAPDLTGAERVTLIRDGLERLHKTGLRIKDVKGELWIFEEKGIFNNLDNLRME